MSGYVELIKRWLIEAFFERFAGASRHRLITSNRASQGMWADYRRHRAQIMAVIQPYLQSASVCILGAGNCNDVRLRDVARRARQVVLVDIDEGAMRSGVRRQAVRADNIALVRCDLTGSLELFNRWSRRPPSDQELDIAVDTFGDRAPYLGHQFDLVLSMCVTSQLSDLLVATLGVDHPRLNDLIIAVRDQHIGLMLRHLLPSGKAVLITDLVSSDTVPRLARVPSGQLPDLVWELVSDSNFFTGANPAAVLALLRSDQRLAPLIRDVALLRPWVWRLGNRSFLVYGILITKATTKMAGPVAPWPGLLSVDGTP